MITYMADDAVTEMTTPAAEMTTPTTTEKPYEDFMEVRVAVMIDRVYIPVVVSVGTVGNMLSFFTLIFSSLRHTSTCIYMAAISALDCVILVLDLCVLVRGYLGHAEFYLSNDWACGFHNFLFYFSIHFDVLLMLAMTVDRFIVVRFPLRAQNMCTPGSAAKVTAVVGLLSFALNGHIFFTKRMGLSGDPEDPLRCWYPDPVVDFFMKKVYTWIDASIYSFIPFLSLLVLNALIIRQVRISHRFSRQFIQRPCEKSVGRKSPGHRLRSNESIMVYGNEEGTSYNGCHPSTYDAGSRSCQTGDDSMTRDVTLSQSVISITSRGGSEEGVSSARPATGSMTRTDHTNITAMLLLVSFTFLVLTSPVVIVLLYKRYYWLPSTNGQRARARLLHAFVDNLMYTNHAINFLLYCLSGRRFRYELKRLLEGVCRCHR